MIYCFTNCVVVFSPQGQDGTLQSFSIVHERFNKSLGHGKNIGHFALSGIWKRSLSGFDNCFMKHSQSWRMGKHMVLRVLLR